MKSNKKRTYKELEDEIASLKRHTSIQKENGNITLPQNWESRLLENQQNYKLLFENMPSAFVYAKIIYENDKPVDFEFIEVNSAFTELTGLKNVVGKKESEVIPGIQHSDSEMFEIVGRVATTGIPELIEYYVNALDKWFNVKIFSPIKGYYISVSDDISKRKHAEEELIIAKEKAERNEKDLNKVQELTQTGSWYLNLATNEVTWTKELYKMYGFDPTLPAPPYNEQHKIFTPESWKALSLEVDKIRETGIPYELELKTIRENGSNGWMWARGETVVDKDNRTIGLWGSAQDISERKLATEELLKAKRQVRESNQLKAAQERAKKNQERFLSLMLNMEAGVVVHAADTSIIQNNKRASEILGLSDAQLKGKTAIDPDWKFVKLDKSPLPLAEYPVNRIATSKTSIKSQLVGLFQPNKDDIVWLTVNGFPVLNSAGDITEIVNIFIDITEQKQNEEDKLTAKLRLEKTENELNEAQKLAHIGSWLFNIRTQKNEWSEEMFNIWGFDSSKPTPEYNKVVTRIHRDDLGIFNHAVAEASSHGTPYDIEFRICLPNDEQKTIRTICQPIRQDTGEVVSLTGTNQDISEQKQDKEDKLEARLKLEKTQIELNEAQKLAHIGSWLFDLTTQKIEWSDETFHIWGLDSKKDAAPEFDTMIKQIHPDDLELFTGSVEKAASLGIPYNIEHRLCLTNGEQKVIRAICQPVLGMNGEVVSLAGTGQDITEQKLIEKSKDEANIKFEKTQKELIKAQKLAHLGSWLFYPPSKTAEWSDEMFHIWGFDLNKPVPEYDIVANRIHRNDVEIFNNAIEKASNPGTPYDIEFRIYLPNNEQKTIRAICQPVFGDSGEVLSLSGTNQDISEQKRIEKSKAEAKIKLEKTQNELIKAQKLAHVGSWLFNPLSQKSEWSSEMFRIWGFDSKIGAPEFDPILERVHSNDLALFNSCLAEAISLGTPFDIEFRICIPDEEPKVVRSICKPVLGVSGKVISLTGSTQDITLQKQFEQAQVKHQRLKAIGEMSSSIAHDFNNSLQEMMGNLEVVKLQTELSDRTVARLNNIGSIIGDVAGRVSALQKFGDTENVDKNAKLIDFNMLIEESLEQSRPLWKDSMEKEGLSVTVKTDFEDVPKIRCNSGELKSAIYNLIKNSIEAMPKGGDLIIKTGIKSECVFASFTDTGIGMDEESQLKIFEPFFTTKGFNLGRGLGMSGVYSIVKKFRGDIVVKSSVLGKGTTIEMAFPVSEQEEIKVISENETKDKAQLNVLWVDDDFIITKSSRMMVESIGHKCSSANSGKKALEFMDNNTCDIVFTDIGMPIMNGWDLADAIRNKFGNKIKIVAVTGWNIDQKAKEKHGIDFVLQKPFTLEELKIMFLAV